MRTSSLEAHATLPATRAMSWSDPRLEFAEKTDFGPETPLTANVSAVYPKRSRILFYLCFFLHISDSALLKLYVNR